MVKPTPFHGVDTGSNPVRVIVIRSISSEVERLAVNQEVEGALPL